MPIKSPKEIAESIADNISVTKATKSADRLLILAILAGVYIAFGGILMTTVKVGTAEKLGTGVANMLGGAAFSVGLMLVVIAGAELFTGNCLVPMGVLRRKISVVGVAKNWIVVYLGNVIGSLLLVFLMFYSGLYGSEGTLTSLGTVAVSISRGKANLGADTSGWIMAFCRGILCNWLVCLAVWLAVSSDNTTGKIFSCFFPIMAFVAAGFEHSIANWYLIPIGYLLDPSISLSSIGMNLIIVTLGNIVGGVFFVGFLYWFVYLRGDQQEEEEQRRRRDTEERRKRDEEEQRRRHDAAERRKRDEEEQRLRDEEERLFRMVGKSLNIKKLQINLF